MKLKTKRLAIYRYTCRLCGKRRTTRVYARSLEQECYAEGCAPRHRVPSNQPSLFAPLVAEKSEGGGQPHSYDLLEMFCGTKSIGKAFVEIGVQSFSIDLEERFDPTLRADVLELSADQLPRTPVIWASPPCTAFSVASMGHHWGGGRRAYLPKTEGARLGVEIVQKTIALIEELQPRAWFIENPSGVLRKLPFMQGFRRVTVHYCHYGDTRMKPTDIWTNTDWEPRPACHNRRKEHPEDCCCRDHEAAPRGAKTGTQGLSGAQDRGVIPHELGQEIAEYLRKSHII
jgi:hypothetical protein